MDDRQTKDLIEIGRNFMKSPDWSGSMTSDQDKKLPQPALYHEAKKGSEVIALPRDFEKLKLNENLFELLRSRKSRRIYSEEALSLLELSFLLWSAQGIKGKRGEKYATLRTVPSGGARHGFECYVDVKYVVGLEPGIYHYLSGGHALEFTGTQSADERLQSVEGQKWASRAAAIFYFTAVPYRFEWRYSIFAHRIALVDLGHVGENLYLAAEALKLGTCGIGAFSQSICDRVLKLDGKNEFTVYVQPVGKVRDREESEESAFYSFVTEEGL
jgi:SagB-type dehydrogenase family enzyme